MSFGRDFRETSSPPGGRPGSAVVASAAVIVTIAPGLIGTWSALGQKPATMLRNL